MELISAQTTQFDGTNESMGPSRAKEVNPKDLKSFRCGGNLLATQGVQYLCKALHARCSQSLEELDLTDNNIPAEAAAGLCKALAQFKNLKRLTLDFNPLGRKGGEALGDLIKRSKLTSLSLRSTSLGSEGVVAVGDALKSNSSISLLDISHNNCGARGARAVGAALEVNSSLEFLSMADNCIDASGATHIGNGLRRNAALRHLNISSNDIGLPGQRVVLRALAENSRIEQCSCDDFGGLGGAPSDVQSRVVKGGDDTEAMLSKRTTATPIQVERLHQMVGTKRPVDDVTHETCSKVFISSGDKYESIKESNVGMKLLKKLGWKGGSLGVKGKGLVDPVMVDGQTNRVGLGYVEDE